MPSCPLWRRIMDKLSDGLDAQMDNNVKLSLFFGVVVFLRSLRQSVTYLHQWSTPSLVQIMACHLCGAKPWPVGHLRTNFNEISTKIQQSQFPHKKVNLNMLSAKWQLFQWRYSLGTEIPLQWCYNVHDSVSNHRCDMAFIEPMHRNKPNITYLSQITSLMIVYSAVYSGEDQRKHQSSTSLAFVWGIHRWLVNFLHKCTVTRKMFPFDDVIMLLWYCSMGSHDTAWYAHGFILYIL